MPLNNYFEDLKNELIKLRFQNTKMMNEKLVFDEETRSLIKEKQNGYTYGVVYTSQNYIEFGWFKISPKNVVTVITSADYGTAVYPVISKEAIPGFIWSNKLGYYIFPNGLTKRAILEHTLVKGQGNFPYLFPKHYEAVESFKLFEGAQKVLEDIKYPLANNLRYTFGLEFETSMGYIPQEICFRDGLIPLRDGSIPGIEYSTVVLEGNKGLNLLKQQLDTLKDYTKFNKECALHIHMGGFPVEPVTIFALYCLWYNIEQYLENYEYVPNMTFCTSLYKSNKKDYCNRLSGRCSSFEELFESITGKKYLGSLVQPHPMDIEKRAKWNIRTRYYGLNLVNMLCYKGPKTVEFRFLRPTFNYRKVTLWLYILNAVLIYAELLANEWKKKVECGTFGMMQFVVDRFHNLPRIFSSVYDEDTTIRLIEELDLLRISVQAQKSNGDYCGRDVEFEEELFK